MPYTVKGKCVYRKNADGSQGKKVGCTEGDVNDYLAALHARADESAVVEITRRQLRGIIKEELLRESQSDVKTVLNNVIIKARKMFNNAVASDDIDVEPGNYTINVKINLRDEGYPAEITSDDSAEVAESFRDYFNELHVYATDRYKSSTDNFSDDDIDAYRLALQQGAELWSDYAVSLPLEVVAPTSTEYGVEAW